MKGNTWQVLPFVIYYTLAAMFFPVGRTKDHTLPLQLAYDLFGLCSIEKLQLQVPPLYSRFF